MPPKRRDKPTDSFDQVEIPQDKAGLVIGRKGASIQSLGQKYDVSVDIPKQVSYNMMGQPVFNATIRGTNPHGAKAEILGIVSGAGAGGGMGGGAGAGGAKMGSAFIFKLDAATREVQLLLQHKQGTWAVPSERLDQPGDDQNGGLAGIYRIIIQGCGAQQPPLDQLGKVDPIQVAGKSLFHFLMPVGAPWDQWQPAPQRHLAASYGDGALSVVGVQFHSVQSHAWVDVGALQGEVKNPATQLDKSLSLWFKHNASNILPKVQQEYFRIYGPGCCLITERAPVMGAVGGAAAAAPEVPGWTQTEQGRLLLGNLKAMVVQMSTFADADLAVCAEKVFNPHHLLLAMQKWAAAGVPLPTNPAMVRLQ